MTTMRARDVDRADACEMLDAAYAAGELSRAEHDARTEAAAGATTLRELNALIADLQLPDLADKYRFRPAQNQPAPAPPKPPRDRVLTGSAIGVAVLVAAIVGFLVWIIPTDDSGPADTTPTSMHTAAGLGRMLDEMQREFGDLLVSQVLVHPDYAVIERPIPDKPGLNQYYNYKIIGGAAQLTEGGTSSRDSDPPTDLAPLRSGLPRVIGLLYGADQTLRVAGAQPEETLILLGSSYADVEIHLSNRDQGTSGSLSLTLDGEVQSVRRADQ